MEWVEEGSGTAPWRSECIKQGYKGGRDMGTRIRCVFCSFLTFLVFFEIDSSPLAAGRSRKTFAVPFSSLLPLVEDALAEVRPPPLHAEHDIEIGDGDGDDSDPSAPLICVFAFLAKTALVENLVRNEVIRCVSLLPLPRSGR